jgi:hypothetical protein
MSSSYPFSGAMTRPCMRCGAPLALKESQCSRCGAYKPPPQGQPFGMPQQAASGPLWGAQPPQSPQIPMPGNGAWSNPSGSLGASAPSWGSMEQASSWSQPQPQNSLFAGQNQSPPPQQFSPGGFGNGTGLLGQNGFGPGNGTGFSGQNQSLFTNSFAGSGFQQNLNQSSLNNSFFTATQQTAFSSPSQRLLNNPAARPAWMKRPDEEDEDEEKKRPHGLVVAVIIVLLVAVIGAGGYGAYRFIRHQNNANTTQNALTIATPTGTPLFRDMFTNNNAGWDLTNPPGAKVTLTNNGKLLLESDNNEIFQELLPGGKIYSDFRLDVDAGLTEGDPANGYGVYIRGASTQGSVLGLYYRFEVYGDGSFVIYKGTLDANGQSQSIPLKSSGPNNAIGPKGQLNHLTIIAKGPLLTFIVNGTTVANFTDDTYKSGTIALFVSNVAKVAAGAQATFERLAIFPAS